MLVEVEQLRAEAEKALLGAAETSILARELAHFYGTLPASF